RRALARDRRELPDLPVVHVGSPHGPREHVEAVIAPRLDELEQMRVGLELGLSDYVNKNGFGEVVVGVSGGIDSALTAALAVEALGPLRVHCVSMPSRYSSAETRDDARRLAAKLGADFRDLAGGFALIKDVFKTDVFRLARHMNERAGEDLIPETIIERAPSAELRDNQLDEDSLPPYPALDKVLAAYVEEDRSAEELSADG